MAEGSARRGALSRLGVIPAKAGIHLALMPKIKVDSRFRGNDAEVETTRAAGNDRSAGATVR
jgi:hypothetical protein